MPLSEKLLSFFARPAALVALAVSMSFAGSLFEIRGAHSGSPNFATIEQLGEALFFDTSLSKNRTESCATCHAPDAAFVDPRDSEGVGRAVSIGDDAKSLGNRNTPTVLYAALAPNFGMNSEKKLEGGFFLDGRAATLEEQASQPPLNPIEMGMPDKASVVARLKENSAYGEAFDRLFGNGVLSDTDKAYAAMASAIAAFERTKTFSPFDSKYDRYLRGEVKLNDQEELGRILFFSNQFTNCSQCHKLKTVGGSEGETFTNYQYFNIGVPENPDVMKFSTLKKGKVDGGLEENTNAADPANAGKFKVPTLRNVAVTAPYMHNGVFKDLRTVVAFYNKYNSKNPRHQINPETQKPWPPPEIADNIATKELTSASALKSRRVDAIVAFLKTLTDKRYEPLLEQASAKTSISDKKP